jgi:hypothetical protein
MKYEIVMRYEGNNCAAVVTPSFGDAYMYGDLDYVMRCLAQCMFRTYSNGYKIVDHIYKNVNGHAVLWGFVLDNGCSYCIRKAVKQEKFNVMSR